MQVCEQRAKAAAGLVFPSNSGNKPHRAYAWREGAQELNGCFCSCQAFIFGRSRIAKAEGVAPQQVTFVCKHLQQIFDTHCDWRQTTEREYRYDRTCPKCGGGVVDGDDVVAPEDTAEAVDDLRSLLAEISGEEPPPPLPKPKKWTIEFSMVTAYRVDVEAFTYEEARKTLTDDPSSYVGLADEFQSDMSGFDSILDVYEATAKPTAVPTDPDTVPDDSLAADITADAASVAAELAKSAKPRRKRSA